MSRGYAVQMGRQAAGPVRISVDRLVKMVQDCRKDEVLIEFARQTGPRFADMVAHFSSLEGDRIQTHNNKALFLEGIDIWFRAHFAHQDESRGSTRKQYVTEPSGAARKKKKKKKKAPSWWCSSAHRLEVHALGHLAHHLLEQVHGLRAVCLQGFDDLLAREQRLDLVAQLVDLGDVLVELLDLGGEERCCDRSASRSGARSTGT